MKKFAALVGAGAMLLAAAVPAFAHWNYDPGADISIHNSAHVYNNVDTNANSGLNGSFSLGGSRINSGDALSQATVGTEVNSTILGCGCVSNLDDVHISNHARVTNHVDTNANTGLNFSFGGGHITTGGATGKSVVTTVVNYTQFGLLP